MNPSYLAKNVDDLYESASPAVQTLIEDGEVNNVTSVLGKIYRLPVTSYVPLSNLISFILIGALKPADVTRALVDMVGIKEDDAYKLAQDLEKGILEKARMSILGKKPTDVVELTFKKERSPDELRKEILDTTKRESALVKEQASTSAPSTTPTASPSQEGAQTGPTPTVASPAVQKKVMTAPGSRSQLLEQLRVLDDIPNDDEVTERLSKIQEQIADMEKKNAPAPDASVPLQNYMFGEKGIETVAPAVKSATYSKAPIKYNVDPYREIAED